MKKITHKMGLNMSLNPDTGEKADPSTPICVQQLESETSASRCLVLTKTARSDGTKTRFYPSSGHPKM